MHRSRFALAATLFTLVVSPLLLAACGTGKLSFDKPGVMDAERQRDQKECGLASADDTDSSHILLVYGIDRDAYVSCMTARGYTVVRGTARASR
jgi:hypothetical protein